MQFHLIYNEKLPPLEKVSPGTRKNLSSTSVGKYFSKYSCCFASSAVCAGRGGRSGGRPVALVPTPAPAASRPTSDSPVRLRHVQQRHHAAAPRGPQRRDAVPERGVRGRLRLATGPGAPAACRHPGGHPRALPPSALQLRPGRAPPLHAPCAPFGRRRSPPLLRRATSGKTIFLFPICDFIFLEKHIKI